MGVKKRRKEAVLVIDDSPDTLEMLHRSIEHMGFKVYSCEGAREAIEILKGNHVDLVITDYHMPFIGGIDVIRHVRENYRNTEVMMITGYASVEGAIEAIKAGAEEYLSKPFTDEELEQAIERSIEKLSIRALKNEIPLKSISRKYGIIGESESMKKVFESIRKAAAASLPVLISGETGTGRELVARTVHYESSRSDFPFISVNCRNIPETVLEREVFGFIKSGSNDRKNSDTAVPGFLELAGEGAVFFNEINLTSAALQVKLLRALTGGEITRAGDSRVRKISCRIMASTSRDLIALASRGLFREDLFFRLNMMNISLPSLRERGKDIIHLSMQFLKESCREEGRQEITGFTDRASRSLLEYSWPGNIRELESIMKHISRNAEGGTVDVSDMPGFMRYNLTEDSRLDKTLEEVEIQYIKDVLARLNGNKTRAAEILGIDRKTLRDKLGK